MVWHGRTYRNMIGELVLANTSHFNKGQTNPLFKLRPLLIIGQADPSEFSALPCSTISNKTFVDKIYDIELCPKSFPLTKLMRPCYIRVHKSMIINRHSINSRLSNIKVSYPDLFLEILVLFEEYNKKLVLNAL